MRLSAKFCWVGALALLTACNSGLEGDMPSLSSTATSTTVTVAIKAAADDAEQLSTGIVNSHPLPLDLSHELGIKNTLALRFTGLKIPRGSTINAAKLRFVARGNTSGAVNMVIRAEAADNSAPLVGAFNLRPKTTAYAQWAPTSWTAGSAYASADLRNVVQQVVARAGWASGNAATVFIDGSSLSAARRAFAYENDATKAVRLSVTYTPPTTVTEEPTTPPPPPPPVTTTSCLNDNATAKLRTLSGTVGAITNVYGYTTGVAVDSRAANFSFPYGDGTPRKMIVSYRNASSLCISGGVFHNGLFDDTIWDTFHSSPTLYFDTVEKPTVENIAIIQGGDAVTFKNNVPNWTFRNSYVRHSGDDGIENDRFNDGVVDNVLIDWAYTGFSCRREGTNPIKPARVTIKNSLIALKLTKYGYKGGVNHNELFKWTKNSTTGCYLSIQDNVFLIQKNPGYIDPSADPFVGYDALNNAACVGHKNIIVYTGTDSYTYNRLLTQAPDCFTVTRDINVWKNARQRWFDRNPQFEAYRYKEPTGYIP